MGKIVKSFSKKIITFFIINTLVSLSFIVIISIATIGPSLKFVDISVSDIIFNKASQSELQKLDTIVSKKSEELGKSAAEKVFKSFSFLFPESKVVTNPKPMVEDPLKELDRILIQLEKNSSNTLSNILSEN